MHVLQLKYHNQMDKSIHFDENFFIYMKKLKSKRYIPVALITE